MVTEYILEYKGLKYRGERLMEEDIYDKKVWGNSVSGILTKMWRIAVILKYINKDGNVYCAMCGSPGPIDIHHIVPKAQGLRIKYEVNNGMPLCRKCHSQAEEPKMRRKIIKKIGKRTMDELIADSKYIVKFNPSFIQETFHALCIEIEELIDKTNVTIGEKYGE